MRHRDLLISDIIKSASEEIQIIFPTSNTLYRYEHEVMLLKLLREKILIPSRKNNNKIKIRILVPETNSLNKEKMQKLLLVKGEGRGLKKEKIKEENSNFNIRYLNRSHMGNNKLTTLIIDNEFVITVELKDYTNVTKDQAIGLTTYSNSEATVLSYASIFETLWTQTELNE